MLSDIVNTVNQMGHVLSIILILSTSPVSPEGLKSNKVTRNGEGSFRIESHLHRNKRQTVVSQMTNAEKKRTVDLHNEYRGMEGAANMELMIWNDYLASMAQEWAEGCNWKHGQPRRPESQLPYSPIGQNLFIRTINRGADPIDYIIAAGMKGFYDEKHDHDFNTGACSGDLCGHYTQVVWAGSREVGCAYHYCSHVRNLNWGNAYYFVCNYGPAGNVQGARGEYRQPYIKGAPCSRCENNRGWCYNGLCNRFCTSSSDTCQCHLRCKNCGVLQTSDCSCRCQDGWYKTDCSQVCRNTHRYCLANPGWPPSWCQHKDYGDQVREGCPAMCAICNKANGTAVPCGTEVVNGNIKYTLIASIFVISLTVASRL